MSALDALPLCSCCADGAALVRWLESCHVSFGCLPHAEQRAAQRWRHGQQARFDTVERVLLHLGLSVDDVPEQIWRPYDNGRRGYRGGRRA